MSYGLWTCRSYLRRISVSIWRRAQSTSANTISPALLSRARSIVKEHKQLNEKLAEAFETQTAKKIGELTPVVTAYTSWENANSSFQELQTLLKDSKTDSELRELASEDFPAAQDDLSTASQHLTSSLVPKHPFAHLPCLVEIRPGAGGSEAALFAGDLLRMYQSYCSSQALRSKMLKYEDSDGAADPNGSDAPLQEAILEVESQGAYDLLRCEAGVHRVQRVPATETKGRTHTSAASVLVLPLFPSEGGGGDSAGNFDDPSSDFYIDPDEVRLETMRARGAGGQHVNKTESAIRLTHIPTGTVVSMQDSRSQQKNREIAWGLLRGRIAQTRREAREDEMLKMRRSVVGVGRMGREDKIRTYNWSQQRVTDHRSGLSVHDLDDVITGGDSLEKIMGSVRTWQMERDIENLIAANEAEAGADK